MFLLLQQVEIVNFKSYRGKHTIGLLKPFCAVIGINGAGKSNFMDAISFVMGETMQNLRVRRMTDLIHGAIINRPIDQTASVAAIFRMDDEGEQKELNFQRVINGAHSVYKINGNTVSAEQYLSELKKLGIDIKAKNFLVYQGTIESIALKTSKELTALFEKVGGSDDLKNEYNRLKLEVHKNELNVTTALHIKKGIIKQGKEARLEKEEADKYTKLKNDLDKKLMEYQLFRLFHNEREISHLENDLNSKLTQVETLKSKKTQVDEALKENKKKHGVCGRELAKIEQDIREMDVKIFKKRPQFIKVKVAASHMQDKLNTATETLAQARRLVETHNIDIHNLEEELDEAKRMRDEFEASLARDSQSQGRDINLEDEQAIEYRRLKSESAQQAASCMQEMEFIDRKQKANQDQLDSMYALQTGMTNALRQKNLQKKEITGQIEKVTVHIGKLQEALLEQQVVHDDLQSHVVASKDRIQSIEEQLDGIHKQLRDADSDRHEDARKQKHQEIVQRLKGHVNGVYDRLINMCEPVHKRYNVAVTKVFGRHMDSIVVDTEHTAQQCIIYLKEQRLGVETFLPLTNLKVKPIADLRNITDMEGVKPLYDVLRFEPEEIYKAVRFATNDAFVCESLDDARQVAFDLGRRCNAVALDGTYFRKSGLFSGGTLDLARKARRWDDKHISQLEEQKNNLIEEHRATSKQLHKELELKNVAVNIQNLEARIKFAMENMNVLKKDLQSVEAEIKQIFAQKVDYEKDTSITEIENIMKQQEQEIQEIKLKINNMEDKLFSRFCQEIGIRNIRQYENEQLRVQQEREQKRIKFASQIDRIKNQLEYEHSRDQNIQNKVSLWEGVVRDDKKNIESYNQNMQKQKEDLDRDLQQLEELKAGEVSKKQEYVRLQNEVSTSRRELTPITKDLQAMQREVMLVENKIETKKSDRHTTLTQCKVDDIALPTLEDNLDIIQPDPASASSLTFSENTTTPQLYEREAAIQIDYTGLSNNLKKLKDYDVISKRTVDLLQSVVSLQDTLTKIEMPNMNALQKVAINKEKLRSTNQEFDALCKQTSKVNQEFQRVKQQRFDAFSRCFDHVSKTIDGIYKALMHEKSAQAYLSADNAEEPYLDGINYNCVVPGKRYLSMSNLSGGEKTLAALALFFAVRSYRPAPFFVLDEMDAALDTTNVGKVASFLRDKAEQLQLIVISHKLKFFCHSDMLLGIYPKVFGECINSSFLIQDLIQYRLEAQN